MFNVKELLSPCFVNTDVNSMASSFQLEETDEGRYKYDDNEMAYLTLIALDYLKR